MKKLICLELFGFCDENNIVRRTDAETCNNIRDDLCPDLWKELVGADNLVVCENLQTSSSCTGTVYTCPIVR